MKNKIDPKLKEQIIERARTYQHLKDKIQSDYYSIGQLSDVFGIHKANVVKLCNGRAKSSNKLSDPEIRLMKRLYDEYHIMLNLTQLNGISATARDLNVSRSTVKYWYHIVMYGEYLS